MHKRSAVAGNHDQCIRTENDIMGAFPTVEGKLRRRQAAHFLHQVFFKKHLLTVAAAAGLL